MLTQAENETLTRVGAGTPCGELLRRYWHPVYPEILLAGNPVANVRILGEDLVLYRDRSGDLGLIGQRCPHRRTSMAAGIPEAHGLRCCYHGWLFNGDGQCVEKPLEPPDSTFKSRVKIAGYPVQAMGGLIWGYLGPFRRRCCRAGICSSNPTASVRSSRTGCPATGCKSWRTGAPSGTRYLHGRLAQYVLERQGRSPTIRTRVTTRTMKRSATCASAAPT